LGRSEESEKLNKLIQKYFFNGKLVENLAEACKNPVMNLSAILKVTNFINLLTGCLLPYVNSNKTLVEEDYEKLIIFSLTWALGGVYEMADRYLFHEYLWSKGYPLPIKVKETDSIFDFYLVETKGSLEWKLVVPEEWVPPEKLMFS